MNGGFPPIKKNIKKKTKTSKKKKSLKKTRFVSTKLENVSIKDILSLIKIKKTPEKLINEEEVETVSSI